MLKILVSGSTGQVGNELQLLASQQSDYEFTFKSSDALDLGSAESIKENLDSNIDAFINLGAYTQVDQAEQDTKACYAINADALYHIAKYASPNTKIIHLSSDYVYNSIKDRPILETDPTTPLGVYAKSKRDGEGNLLGLRSDAVVIRTSWVYSSFGHNFVKSMLKLGTERNQLNIVSDQIGAPTYARDIASVLMTCLAHPTLSGIFNYANKGQTHWADYARIIFKLTGIECEVNNISTSEFNAAAPRPEWSVLDCSKITKALNMTIAPWEESLKKCLLELGYEL
ncbi:MAG: dTDP-4-dehydrorhamnose reductase [Saprospiraceae bacterium]|nr:dTDP-4-dehydrorhamnose reductase [Saprospiraceae bacterium]